MSKEKLSPFEQLKAALEVLEVQLNLGGKELKDRLKEHKKALNKVVEDTKRDFGEAKAAKDVVKNIENQVEELLNILEADYNLSYTEFEDSPKKLTKAIQDFEEKLKEASEKLEAQGQQAKEELQEKYAKALHRFKVELAIQQIYAEYNKRKATTEFDKWRKEFYEDLKKIKKEGGDRLHSAEDKFDAFAGEMSKAYQHFRQAFSRLF